MFFWILWCIDVITTLVVLHFFLIGLADGSVSTQNIGLWMIFLTAILGVTGGSYWLNLQRHPTAAKWAASILALPATLYWLFLLLIIIIKPRWN